jgi:hypothetical protein
MFAMFETHIDVYKKCITIIPYHTTIKSITKGRRRGHVKITNDSNTLIRTQNVLVYRFQVMNISIYWNRVYYSICVDLIVIGDLKNMGLNRNFNRMIIIETGLSVLNPQREKPEDTLYPEKNLSYLTV